MHVSFGSLFRWILLLLYYIDGSFCAFQPFEDPKSWPEAHAYCQAMNGHLAHLTSMDMVPSGLRQHQREFWVGGLLNDQGFLWTSETNSGADETHLEPLFFYRGCYRASSIHGGTKMENVTAERCFDNCNWTRSIGLTSSYCLCENVIKEGYRTGDNLCTVSCAGNKRELCGGPRVVSMYSTNKHSVKWAKSEPNSMQGYDCVYIKKERQSQDVLWYTASCSMTLQYLCVYNDNDACGVQNSCIRTSIQPDTWDKAVKDCRLRNGSIAIVDITTIHDADIQQLPAGSYWVNLKRTRRWQWTNGLPITNNLFHHSVLPTNGTCAALTITDSHPGLSKQECYEKKPFLCQYRPPGTRLEKSNGAQKENNETSEQQQEGTTGILEKYQSTLVPNSGKTNTDNKPSKSSNESSDVENTDYQTNLYKSIMYLAIGVASGMAIVFALCVVIYVGKRCRSRGTEFKTVRYPKGKENPILRYASDEKNDPPNHVSPESEVHYEIPCDAQESPFRATQRILQQNYALGRDGFPTNSWRRKKAEKETNNRNRIPEIRHVHPCSNRSYGDTSYIIHNVRAQCHPNSSSRGTPIDINYTGSLDTRLRKPPVQQQQDPDVRLSETYSMVERKLSEPILNVDTSDLYACVQKAMDSQQFDDYYDNGDPNIRVTLC